jgi:ankyrin repeat protein
LWLDAGVDADIHLDLYHHKNGSSLMLHHELLLEEEADTSKAANDGDTPLIAACEEGHDAVVRLLLQYGAKSIEEDEPASSQPPTLCCGSGTP